MTMRTRSSGSACPLVVVGMNFSVLSCVINVHFPFRSGISSRLLPHSDQASALSFLMQFDVSSACNLP